MKMIDTILNEMENKMSYLYARWQDEKEYEDFSEYEKVMQKEFKSLSRDYNISFIKATKLPFGFQFRYSEHKTAQFSVNRRSLKIKIIK